METTSPDLDRTLDIEPDPPLDRPAAVAVKIYDRQELVLTTDLSVPLDFGRQCTGEPGPFCRIESSDGPRIIVAGIRETTISRRHIRLEPREDGRVRLYNQSNKRPIEVESCGLIQPGKSCDVKVPTLLTLGSRVIRLVANVPDTTDMQGLAHPTLVPGHGSANLTMFADLVSDRSGDVRPETIIGWLQSTMEVFQSAASSAEFLPKAARAVVDIVNLDTAAMLRYDGQRWSVESVDSRSSVAVRDDWFPSRTILERVREQKRTFRKLPGEDSRSPHSLVGVAALVAAPILNQHGEVIGALYGDRQQPAARRSMPEITELEAMLVELLASGVATGLARLEQERMAVAARVRFEQFFTLELAQKLESQPDMLASKDTEVTVLFCDLRGFSRITERLGPARTLACVSDVLGEMSDCVMDRKGVLVDYVGDEIMAMWGAPEEAPDHALLACRAALEMIARLPTLNERWSAQTGEPLAVGIGLHTGTALVGNTGTHRKFKYGALGNTVNLASRVQGTTKHVRSPLLVTGSTAAKLAAAGSDEQFHTRRLCSVRVVNIAEPVTLYELVPAATASWAILKRQYEEALAAFEDRRFRAATRILANLLEEYPDDGPTRVLLLRAVSALTESTDHFDPVWQLPTK